MASIGETAAPMSRARTVVLMTLVALSVAAAPARAGTVDAGTLRADTGPAGAWRLSFGDGLLAERATARLGFRTVLGWQRATAVRDERREGDALRLTVVTPGGDLDVTLRPEAEGVVRLEARVADGVAADRVGIGFDARPGERFLGFGERSNAVDQRGTDVEQFVAEGPYQPEERPFIAGIVPTFSIRLDDAASSYPVPWFVSTAGYGVEAASDDESVFRMATAADRGGWSVETEGRRLVLRVVAGPRPADALRRWTALTGRQPAPAAPWLLGTWFMPGDFDKEDRAAEDEHVRLLRDADVPVSVAETTMQELPCGDARRLAAVTADRVRANRAAGLATLGYINPHVCVDYQPVHDRFLAANGFVRDGAGNPYLLKTFADRYFQVLVHLVDFGVPAARRLYGDLLQNMLRDGMEGWMEDYGEYFPPDGHGAGGLTGNGGHNAYVREYHCAAFAESEARRGDAALATFVRAGWRGQAPCSRLVWSGDPTSDWGFDGLRSAVYNGLTMGLSGISLWASELGGLVELGTRKLTPELLTRWVQFGAVSPWMKARKQSIQIPDKGPRPQVWEPGQIANFRRWAKLHTQLLPYLQAAAAEYRRSGLPIMRHLALAYDDVRSRAQDLEYLFGPDLLAAPVVQPGQRSRRVWLPPGAWVDLWRSVRYDAAGSGGLVAGAPAVLAGDREVTLPAPLDELPLLARAGALLPLLPPEVDTLTTHGAGGGLVRYADRRRRLGLLAFPRGRSSAAFDADGRLCSTEGRRRWTLAIRAARTRRIAAQVSLGTLRRPFRPCSVRAGGRPVAFRYDGRTRVLRFTVRARRTTVVARGC